MTALDPDTGIESNATVWYTIDIPLTAVSLTESPASPQPPYTPITLTATATGGADVQYQFWVYNSSPTPAWSELQAYSPSDTCVWNPLVQGYYYLTVTAQDGLTGTEVSAGAWYTILCVPSPYPIITPQPPQPVGTPITITAGPEDPYLLYTVAIYCPDTSPAWTILLYDSSTATCVWTPTIADNYLISISVTNTDTGEVGNWTSCCSIYNPLAAVSFMAVPASPQPINLPIMLAALSEGGCDVQYQFWVYNPAATTPWSELQAYSDAPICVWTPTTAGPYLISVTARDEPTGTEVNATAWETVDNPLVSVSLTTAPMSPQQSNTPITLTAQATGGTNVEFQFWVYNPAATPSWSELQAYSPSDTCVWTPAAQGSYYLTVTAQDGLTGTEVDAGAWYSIINPPIITFTPPLPQPVGTPITISVEPPYELAAVWIYNPATGWMQLPPDASGNYVWTRPSRATT